MQFRFSFYLLVFAAFAMACDNVPVNDNGSASKRSIIDSAIAYHGGSLYSNADIAFTFRDKKIEVSRSGNTFEYVSTFSDSLGEHRRVLSNLAYTETLDGNPVNLSAKDSASHAGTINSIVYFALLPYFLNDPAVETEFIGTDTLDGQSYYKLRVTFEQEGGGSDYEDVYLYWFDTEDYSMDYLAYSYEVNEGGTRFRKARNSRRINGIVFQDYTNFKGPSDTDSLKYIGKLYSEGELEVLSQIEIDRISVIIEGEGVALNSSPNKALNHH
jgi:hypothetical protein